MIFIGLRFKICNWICGDYLRNYLAVGVRLPLINFLKYNSKNLDSFEIKRIENIIECIDEIFQF